MFDADCVAVMDVIDSVALSFLTKGQTCGFFPEIERSCAALCWIKSKTASCEPGDRKTEQNKQLSQHSPLIFRLKQNVQAVRKTEVSGQGSPKS